MKDLGFSKFDKESINNQKNVASHENDLILWNIYGALEGNWTVKIYETLFVVKFIKV